MDVGNGIAIGALVSCLALGCGRAQRTSSSGPPDFSGSIVEVSRSRQAEGTVALLQIDVAEPGPEFRPMTTRISPGTDVLVDAGGTRRTADERALIPGQHADVWLAETGPTRVPSTYEARKIVVRGRDPM
jgi:hypothetical protein